MSDNKDNNINVLPETIPEQKKRTAPSLNINIKGSAQQYIQSMIDERQAYLVEVARNDSYELPLYDDKGNVVSSKTIHKLDISQLVFEDLQKKKAVIDDFDKMTRINLPDVMRLGLTLPPEFMIAHQSVLEKKEIYYQEVAKHKAGIDMTQINTNKRMLLDILDAWMLQEDSGVPSPTNRSSSTSSSMTYR